MSTKSKLNVFDLNLKFVNEFPSNLADSISDKCLTIWRKNYPVHLPVLYVCTLPCKFMAVHPSIHPSVYFADKYKQQINIKVHLQGEWKKRGDSLLSPLTHNILLYF